MTNLKDINFGLNQYCGPAVLSAFTGMSTDECATVISQISGKAEIKAVEVSHLIRALEKLRFEVKREGYVKYSLYMLFINIITHDGLYLILIPDHFIAVEVKDKKIYLIDNHSKYPIDAGSSARLTQRVVMVYKVTPRKPPVYLGPEYEILHYNKTLVINQINRYEDKKDDNKAELGRFRYMDYEELKNIQDKLNLTINHLIGVESKWVKCHAIQSVKIL